MFYHEMVLNEKCPFVQKAGFHPYLGCTVMALAIFQPLVAGFRPSPHGPRYL